MSEVKYFMLALLLISLCGCREGGVPENAGWMKTDGITLCLNGYAFLSYDRGITQLFENTENGVRAVQCIKKEDVTCQKN